MAAHLPIGLILEPEPIGVPQAHELLLDDSPEEFPRMSETLQHSPHINVDIVNVVRVYRGQSVEQLRLFLEECRVDF